jgi:3-deoxy-manno-octulosonate cytidylyltransferase (CMP-KDO synthetase)
LGLDSPSDSVYYDKAVVFERKFVQDCCREGFVEVLAVIPARYGSTRFEGKVLAKDTGKFLVQHTYERALCAKSVEKVLIATDSELVTEACASFGADCVMTSAAHQSGTDRIAEAARDIDAEIIVNLQADEPGIDPANIDELVDLLQRSDAEMATLVARFENSRQISDPNIVKAIVDDNGRAIYFSRSPIPYDRKAGGVGQEDMYLRHLGIYAYRKDFLLKFTSLPQGQLEKCEKLEQLRAIEYGFSIMTGKVEHAWEGIDTPEQYEAFVKRNKKGQGG